MTATSAGRRWLPVAAIGTLTLLLYAWRLHDSPIYLSPDEAIIAVDAHSLATTGYDVHGRFLPLYFQIQMPGETRMGWFTPVIFYLSALVQLVAPLSEAVARMPSVAIGVADVVLIYLIAEKLFASAGLAAIAAALLALTPAHFMLSRYALDYLYPLPFALGWFLGLLSYLESRRLRPLVLGSLSLGVGFYSYIGAVVMMPLYFAITGAVLLLVRAPIRELTSAAVAFAAPLVPFAAWLAAHPTAFADTAQRYELYDPTKLTALQGLRSFFTYPNIERLSSLYWTFYNPSFLFFSGDRQMTFSTRSAGVFLLVLAPLLVLGFYAVVSKRHTIGALLVLVGFVTAPLAALLGSENAAIMRSVELMPFAVLLAVFGVELLFSLPVPGWTMAGRAIAIGLLALVPFQFASFCRDYFGDYRLRSAPWLGGNLRGALEGLIARADGHDVPVYFAPLQSTGGLMDTRNRWMDAYWRFYTIKHGRTALLDRTKHLPSIQAEPIPPRTLVLGNDGDTNVAALVANGTLRIVERVPEVSGDGFFLILERP